MKEGHHHIKGMDWEAQGEIKGSLEEVGEGDQTVVVVARLDESVDNQPTALLLQVATITQCNSHNDKEKGQESTGKENINRKTCVKIQTMGTTKRPERQLKVAITILSSKNIQGMKTFDILHWKRFSEIFH